MTREERARQIDAEEFRRESEQALQRALAYSKQKRMEEHARVTGATIAVQEKAKPFKFTLGRKPELYTYNGIARSITDWATHLNVSCGAFRKRVLKYGIARAIEMGSRASSGPAKQTKKQPRSQLRLQREPTYTFDGITLNLAGWARRFDIAPDSLRKRVRKLGSVEAALAQGGRYTKQGVALGTLTYQGTTLTRAEWADRLGITYNTFCTRVGRYGIAKAIALGGPKGPGVAPDSATLKGTGAGSIARDSVQIDFSEKAIIE